MSAAVCRAAGSEGSGGTEEVSPGAEDQGRDNRPAGGDHDSRCG